MDKPSENLKELSMMLKVLSPKEREIILKRNGINVDVISFTLEEMGKEVGVTRERIRQIEAKAIEKMRFISSPTK
jgi:RNA polymerase primary sigma factor